MPKYAKAISDRSGLEFPYDEMVQNGMAPLFTNLNMKKNIHS